MRDYYKEALAICRGESIMLPQKEHLAALLVHLEASRRDDAAYDKWVDDRAHERGDHETRY